MAVGDVNYTDYKVQDTYTNPGTGDLTWTSPRTSSEFGYVSFEEAGLEGSVPATGMTVYYLMEDFDDFWNPTSQTTGWEYGYANFKVSGGNAVLERNTGTVLSSSNSDAKVNFSASTVRVHGLWAHSYTDLMAKDQNLGDVASATASRASIGCGLVSIKSDDTTNAMGAAIADDNASYTDETTAANNATANDMTLLPVAPVANQDGYLFGYDGAFQRLSLNVGQAGVGTWTITWEYWNGAWTALSGVTDGTTGFTTAGANDVTWTMPTDWALTTINSQGPFFYVRARLTAFTSITTQPLGTQSFAYSEIDADKLDGLEASEIVQISSDQIISADHSFSGNLSIDGYNTHGGESNFNQTSGRLILPVGTDLWAIDTQNLPYTTGLIVHFRSDLGVTADGSGYISQWDDQSDNEYHAVQAGVDAYKPKTGGETLNGIASLDFRPHLDSEKQPSLSYTDTATLYAQPGIMYFVSRHTSVGETSARLFDGQTSGTGWEIYFSSVNNDFSCVAGGTSGRGFSEFTVAQVAHWYRFRLDGDGTGDFDYNGNPGASNCSLGSHSFRPCIIGDSYTNPGGREHFFYLWEWVVFDHIPSAGDQAAIESYLGARYGLTD